MRNTNRITHLYPQDTLQDMNPLLQDIGRVCCQEVGSLFRHKLEGKGVRKYKAAHLKIFSSVVEFLHLIQIFFWSFRRDYLRVRKKVLILKVKKKETQMNQILVSFLAVSVGYCGSVSSLILSCFSVLLLVFHFKGDYINVGFCCLYFVLDFAFITL